MSFSLLDIVHILSIFVQIPLIIVLLYKGIGKVSHRLMAFFFFAQILSSFEQLFQNHHVFYTYPQLAYWTVPFFTIWGPTMFLYIKAETTSGFKLKPAHFIHYIPFLICVVFFINTYHVTSLEEKYRLLSSGTLEAIFRKPLSLFIPIQVFLYNCFSIFIMERFRKRNKSKKRHVLQRIAWNRFIIYGYFIACISNNIARFSLIGGADRNISGYLLVSAILFFLYFAIILGQALMGSRLAGEIEKRSVASITSDERLALKNKLEHFLIHERPYLKFNLSLSELARSLECRERVLSHFINSQYQITFQDFINSYRIEEAKRLIAQSIGTGKTILEIVYECGFNSKSAFHYAFKKHTQITPSNYKKAVIKQLV